ncbi:MAG TPA: hypothetical protein VKM72_14945 [Thermoanaerobaculia bacterium]|nr:hypothetical protein [Thermoanaerobaculia bacterium]
MARFLAVAVTTLLVLVIWAFLKAQVIPTWKDQPRDEPSFVSRLLEETEYSESFTETGFSKVRPGMTKKSVDSLVGQPLQILQKSGSNIVAFLDYRDGVWHKEAHNLRGDLTIDSEIYYYSRQASPTADWYVRAVTFSDGRVTGVTKTFYID